MAFRHTALYLALSCAFITPVNSFAQQVTTDKNASEQNNQIEKIVVTGVPSGTSQRKVDTSYAITALSDEDIEKLAPKSTADIFKAIPGVWAESSGGVAGANVFVRGFPGTGDAPYLTVQLQGVPLFTPPTLSFLENASLFRMDETIEFMDGLRGGPSSVLSNGQPGLTTNFLLKEGSEDTEGLIKYSTSDYDLQRIDGLVSGELADDLYFMVGGYVSRSKGIRDTGFNTEEGQQLTINITKELDNGKFSVFHRTTDDHGVWYLPGALNVAGVDNNYVQLGTLNRQATIMVGANGDRRQIDLGDGRGFDGSITGGNLELELDNGWTLVDKFAYTSGDANTLGLVPEGGAVMLSAVATNGSNATGAVTGNTYSGDTQVQQFGRWVVEKQIQSFTNDLALTKSIDDWNFTLGYFNSSYSADDQWSLGNQAYYVVQSGGELLTGINCNDNQDSCSWNYDINSTGDGDTRAFYAAADYQLNDEVRLDLGLRRENHEINYSVDEGLDGVVNKVVNYDESDTAWTTGLNWQFERDMGIFARISEGSKMPYFDDFRDNFAAYSSGEDLIQDITQYELGFKAADTDYSLYLTAFFNEVEGNLFVPRPGAPAEVTTNEAYGVELDAAWYADNGFSMTVNATIQETEITAAAEVNGVSIVGNGAMRQPGWQVRFTPSYDFDVNGMEATLYAVLFAADDRFSDNTNQTVLEGYEQVDVGMNMFITPELELQLNIQNLTDEDGLTEGDPRNPAAPNGRFIMPRNGMVSLSYSF